MISPLLPTYARADLAFERGDGAYLISEGGETYLDFCAGIAVNVLGHGHPHVVAALVEQGQKLWHASNLYRIPDQERLAQRLTERCFADKVFFGNSGTEAAECAIKMTRKYHTHSGSPERYRILTFEGAFHGRTLAALAAGGQLTHLQGFGPVVEGFDQLACGDLAVVRAALSNQTAGIMVEPIQGEGGIRVMAPEFLQGLRQICDQNGLVLIFDEVQCGLGRTGKLFAHEHAGVRPDIMILAKALGGGFPIGACLATDRVAAAMGVGSHGSTFGGNPLACHVANAVLDVILGAGFLENVTTQGAYLIEQLTALAATYPDVFTEVRGRGLMLGLKCEVAAKDFSAELMAQHLLSVTAADNVVRLLPALIVDEALCAEAVRRIEAGCKKMRALGADG